MTSMLSGAMAAVGQARTSATAVLEHGVERAKAVATDAVEHARGSVATLSSAAPVPCAVCGRPTRSGDGGACGDVGEMAAKVPKEGPRRCYSCLTAEENEQVEASRKRELQTLDDFFSGAPPPVHVDPEESALEKAHRLGSLALGGAVDLMGWIPVVGSVTKGTIQVLHKVVKFGPLALYSAELVETLQLLVVMANRTGAAKVAEEEAESGKATGGRALEVSEMSVGFYYLLLEHRNAAALDPDRALREHKRCPKVEASVLDELNDCLPLGCTVAYASSAAEAQRQLRLLGNWELVLRESQGPGGQPVFTLAADRSAKRVAVLIPGTQTPQDCVTDLKALPVQVLADGSSVGWVHRGMMRQAAAIVRLVGSALERFEKDGYEVLFIGHSLGAGVSAIAGAVARLGIEKVKLKKVRSLCYATPAVGNGSFGKYCEGHAITVINCEDIVPRLSIETARKLREELAERKEAVRLFVSEDIAALKDVNNITEKKTRSKSASLRAVEVKQGEEAAQELANLGIPPPSPGTAAKVAEEGKAKKERKTSRGGFLCCAAAQEDSDAEDVADQERLDLLEPDDVDPASIRLVPPGRLIHLARFSGARRAWWVRRNHPVLHRIQVHHGIGQDHSGDSYREGLQEALLAAHGILPKPWARVDQTAVCACCSTDFVWSTVLRSEPHRLAARCRCHSCGDVVCDGCSQRKQPLPQVGILREVRVCDRCFLKPKKIVK